MNYGAFINNGKGYKINTVKTPNPWKNILFNDEYFMEVVLTMPDSPAEKHLQIGDKVTHVFVNDQKIARMAEGLRSLATLPDPLGHVQYAKELSKGLNLSRHSRSNYYSVCVFCNKSYRRNRKFSEYTDNECKYKPNSW